MTIRKFNNKSPNIANSAYVDERAVVIGNVVVGSDSSVWPCAVVRGDVQKITIGRCTSIQDNATLHVTHSSHYTPGGNALIIGDYVTIAHGVVAHGCHIGNEVMIGMNSTILDKAVVEDGVMVGAGTIVGPGKVLKSGFLYVGSPVKQVRELTDSEKTFLRYVAENYVKLKNQYLSDYT